MNLFRIKLLYKSHLKAHIRSKQGLLLSLVFPLLFIGVFGIAFQDSPGQSTISLAIMNNDEGIKDPLVLDSYDRDHFSNEFLSVIENLTYEDGIPTFDVKYITHEENDEVSMELERNQITAIMVIPENFSEVLINPAINGSTKLAVRGDYSNPDYTVTIAIIESIVSQFFGDDEKRGIVVAEGIVVVEESSFFDLLVPAMLIFAIMNNLGTVATVALGDVKTGLLDRLRLTKMKPYEYLLTLILSQVTVAIVQIPILFGTAFLFGFPFSTQILYAIIFAVFLALSATAVGVILASIVKDHTSVGGVAGLVSTVSLFLAGAFVPLPNPELFNLGSNVVHLFDFLPPTTSLTALKMLIFSERTLMDVTYELSMTAFLSIFYLIIAIKLYTKTHFKLR